MNGEIVRQETKGKMFFSIYMDTLYLCFSVYIYIYNLYMVLLLLSQVM